MTNVIIAKQLFEINKLLLYYLLKMARRYTAEDYLNMIIIYGECHQNANLALRTYRERYGANRPCPVNSRVITNAMDRIRNNRRVDPRFDHEGIIARQLRVRQEDQILDHFRRVPTSSVRRAERLYNVHRNAVHSVLKREKWHPFKLCKVQALLPRDKPVRFAYCRWLQDNIRETPGFLNYVFWTDESTFTRNGMWNCHNYHYWSLQNPHVCRESAFQYRFSLNVWAGIHGDSIIGPIFIDGTLNRGRFMELLNGPVSEYLDGICLERLRRVWFQLDGAPAHSVVEARQRLNQMFGNQWIGRFGPQRWPPRSPDLTPLDFFLWGLIKEEVYATEVTTIEDLQNRIVVAFDRLKETALRDGLLRRVRRNIERRLNLCVQRDGGHFENLKI